MDGRAIGCRTRYSIYYELKRPHSSNVATIVLISCSTEDSGVFRKPRVIDITYSCVHACADLFRVQLRAEVHGLRCRAALADASRQRDRVHFHCVRQTQWSSAISAGRSSDRNRNPPARHPGTTLPTRMSWSLPMRRRAHHRTNGSDNPPACWRRRIAVGRQEDTRGTYSPYAPTWS
jgi:hypothetical protein